VLLRNLSTITPTGRGRRGATKKQKSAILTIADYDFGQQRLNGAADWSAAKDGRVLPHFQRC
jgi:hypothetical protein